VSAGIASAGPAGLAARLARLFQSPAPWVFFVILGLAVRLRQYFFAASYWYDESFLVLAIRDRGFAALLGAQPYNLVIPPVFLWAVRGLYLLGGDSELLMRLPAFLAGVAALLLMIPLARRLVPRPWSVWAFALMALSPQAVAHGCEVRPYTVDLLVAEWVLLCVLARIEPETDGRGGGWAVVGLGAAALVGPWLSFPSAFVLGGASAALFGAVCRRPTLRGWIGWAALNAAVAASGALLWWVSARYMYYPGMLEHWGQKGWEGFPDWSSPLGAARWLIYRPYEIANYGNRDLGILLAILALSGGAGLAFRSRTRAALLLAPFALALAAALIGKYPLAHRTTVFLLPGQWLLAAVGMEILARRAGRRTGWAAGAAVVLAAYAAAWTLPALIWPDPGLDYRGAYHFVQAHKRPDDRIWSQVAVVYQTYYGENAPVLTDDELPTAERLAGETRLWAVFGDNRADLRRRLESSGGRVALEQPFNGLVVLLFEPSVNPSRARSGAE
jgi:hypothetical protein